MGGYTVLVTVLAPGYAGTSTATLVIAGPGLASFNQWEGYYGFTNANQNGLADIPLHDGVPNLLKYYFDIDPTLPMSPADFSAMGTTGSMNNGQTLTLTFREYALATGVTLNVYTSTDLRS